METDYSFRSKDGQIDINDAMTGKFINELSLMILGCFWCMVFYLVLVFHLWCLFICFDSRCCGVHLFLCHDETMAKELYFINLMFNQLL